MHKIIILVTFALFANVYEIHCRDRMDEHARLNFTVLANQYIATDQSVEEYEAVTEDGYILKLFRIPGDSKRPVLLMHGFIDSADTFIIRGRRSLAVALADQGYDVWAGTSRGSRYSRRHVLLNPDIDKRFWDFSFHETGYYDLPAIVDFILHKTGQASLSAIGHSQGNTIFYVLGSTRPEYNAKINVVIAVSPVCFLEYLQPPVRMLVILGPFLNNLLKSFDQEEIFSDKSALKSSIAAICEQRNIGYEICAHGIFFMIGGSDPDEIEPEFFPIIVTHYPASTSRKNALHLYQIASNRSFSQFDYGASRNLELYQSTQPAKYDLGKVKMRVAMLFGENDGLSSLEDVKLLRDNLPNVVEYRKIDHKKFSHLDGVWGRNMKIYLYPSIFEILQKYNEPM